MTRDPETGCRCFDETTEPCKVHPRGYYAYQPQYQQVPCPKNCYMCEQGVSHITIKRINPQCWPEPETCIL